MIKGHGRGLSVDSMHCLHPMIPFVGYDPPAEVKRVAIRIRLRRFSPVGFLPESLPSSP